MPGASSSAPGVISNSSGAVGQANTGMPVSRGASGTAVRWERPFNDGAFNSFDLYWDAADQLNQINVHGGSAVFATRYHGDGERVTTQDTVGGASRPSTTSPWDWAGCCMTASAAAPTRRASPSGWAAAISTSIPTGWGAPGISRTA